MIAQWSLIDLSAWWTVGRFPSFLFPLPDMSVHFSPFTFLIKFIKARPDPTFSQPHSLLPFITLPYHGRPSEVCCGQSIMHVWRPSRPQYWPIHQTCICCPVCQFACRSPVSGFITGIKTLLLQNLHHQEYIWSHTSHLMLKQGLRLLPLAFSRFSYFFPPTQTDQWSENIYLVLCRLFQLLKWIQSFLHNCGDCSVSVVVTGLC